MKLGNFGIGKLGNCLKSSLYLLDMANELNECSLNT